jgi:succinate dehydrogenase / fumarate reductase, cytochrome b subunit
MNWFTQALSSSIGKKLMVALTGSFLIIFLIGHLGGNLLLFKAHEDGGQAFNEYARFMTTNQFVQILSIITYTAIFLHIVYSIAVTIANRKARPVDYAVSSASDNSSASSRNMGILGTLIFLFLVIHLRSFWYEMHFGDIPFITYKQGGQVKDLYAIVVAAFSQLWYVVLYVIAMIALAFHLSHGFRSAFQTLGLRHRKYTPFIEKVGYTFAVIVPVVFALMPVYIYFKTLY